MRFSAALQQALAAREAARPAEPAREEPQPAAPALPAPELPEDLDVRVRLVGEWQLLEG